MAESAAASDSPAGQAVRPSSETSSALFPAQQSWKIGLIVAAAMVVLALGGVGLSTTNSATARTYWVVLVPIYGALCIATAWARSRHSGKYGWAPVVRQALHWLAIALALTIDFFFHGAGQETGAASGLSALLLLAVGCLLAGVHFEWLFGLVGLLLLATLVVVVKANEYLWLIFLAGGVVVAVMLVVMRWFGPLRARRGHAAEHAPTGPGAV